MLLAYALAPHILPSDRMGRMAGCPMLSKFGHASCVARAERRGERIGDRKERDRGPRAICQSESHRRGRFTSRVFAQLPAMPCDAICAQQPGENGHRTTSELPSVTKVNVNSFILVAENPVDRVENRVCPQTLHSATSTAIRCRHRDDEATQVEVGEQLAGVRRARLRDLHRNARCPAASENAPHDRVVRQ